MRIYEVYLNFVNRTAKYHAGGCPRAGGRPTSRGRWIHGVDGLDAVFAQGMQDGVKAVIPADCCLKDSKDARCIGCAGG